MVVSVGIKPIQYIDGLIAAVYLQIHKLKVYMQEEVHKELLADLH